MDNDKMREEFEQSPRFRGMDFQRAPEAPDYYLSPYANGAWDGWKASLVDTAEAMELLMKITDLSDRKFAASESLVDSMARAIDLKDEVIDSLKIQVSALQGQIETQKQVISLSAELISMVEGLRKDSARLDRLEMECEAYGTDVHEGNRWVVDGPFATVRDAIDAAMSNEASHD